MSVRDVVEIFKLVRGTAPIVEKTRRGSSKVI
jgi:hypothetical protein